MIATASVNTIEVVASSSLSSPVSGSIQVAVGQQSPPEADAFFVPGWSSLAGTPSSVVGDNGGLLGVVASESVESDRNGRGTLSDIDTVAIVGSPQGRCSEFDWLTGVLAISNEILWCCEGVGGFARLSDSGNLHLASAGAIAGRNWPGACTLTTWSTAVAAARVRPMI